ncbi:hypothetical protein EJV47_13110 [Hymenobacter gummosus]|uniref:Uncharacterized protein n=1 Tax=Hymenobacter gummosus TaxID=1776032 RepID=A0A3S0JH64_9BACT|nr:hypothetical protein [Hymenobacter gummosus]RTQ49745.1 hypothetical protein EJV47_13110 [Hymenobacter gummosus]
MIKQPLPALLLAGALLTAAPASAQAPAAEVQALTKRLNELLRDPNAKEHTEVLVSLADCGVRQTVRKYRSPGTDGSLNISVSNSKNGSNWGVKSNDKVELELNLGLDWSEIGAVSYQPRTDEESGRPYYELKLLRRPAAAGGNSSGLDAISLPLYTQDEKAVADVVRRLGAVRRQCSGQKG